MSTPKQRKPSDPPVQSARDLSVEDRMRILGQAADATPDELGALLRRNGLTTADLDAWKAALGDAGKPQRKPRKSEADKAEARRIRKLERELARKEKALAEAAAIIVLQKKVREALGDEDDDTPPRTGR